MIFGIGLIAFVLAYWIYGATRSQTGLTDPWQANLAILLSILGLMAMLVSLVVLSFRYLP
jgi:hypothetical protein